MDNWNLNDNLGNKEVSKMDITDNIIEDDVDEVIDDNKLMAYDIAVFYNTYNLSTLMKWWGTKLIVPEFQRSYVWNIKQASEFVDSILRGLPVPSMFFSDDGDKLLVVDGQQRLRSLYKYIKENNFSGKTFKLTGNIHPNWSNKSYDELLSEDKDRLDDALLNITVMRQLAPDDGQSAMYLAFQRINTGGITLKAQEIRMAVSYGPLSVYLDQLSRDKRFDKWGFLRTEMQRRNENYTPIQELILKFFAYYFSYPKFSGSSTRVLLDEFFSNQKNFETPKNPKKQRRYYSKEEFENAFESVLDIINALPIECLSPYREPTQTFLESIWVGLTYRKLVEKKAINTSTLEYYIMKWKSAIGEDEFEKLFKARRTSSTQSAFMRIEAGVEYFKGDF